jgi:hypothetical protein
MSAEYSTKEQLKTIVQHLLVRPHFGKPHVTSRVLSICMFQKVMNCINSVHAMVVPVIVEAPLQMPQRILPYIVIGIVKACQEGFYVFVHVA